MVDRSRVLRLLAQIEVDVDFLAGFAALPATEIDRLGADPVALRSIKYAFVTAIEGCAKVAHHIAASEAWPPAETNGDAVRVLGAAGVVDLDTAAAVAEAVGFRNLLVHQYADVDARRTVAHLGRLDDLRRFASAVARWLAASEEAEG